jgi:glycosyl transferase family 22 (putative mannosyltransferase)
VEGAPAAMKSKRSDPVSLFLDVLAIGLAASYLVRLWQQAAPATFASDECFHAYLSEWIARHGRLPRELPEFYSGLPYFYPPLFHLVGAVSVKLAGPASLKFLNVLLTGALLGVICALPVPGLSRAARRCALLLCLASPALTLFAVRFYAETLATLLAVLAVTLIMRARAQPGVREGVLLGVAVGAGLLAKQSAPALPVLVAALMVIDLVRGRRRLATTMLIALLIGLGLGLPFFLRNAILFGGPFFPPITNDAQVALHAMNSRIFSLPAPRFYLEALNMMGPIVPWLGLLALAWTLLRRRLDLSTGLLAGCLAFILLGPFLPLFQPRHLNPVTAILALVGSLVLTDALAGRRWVSIAAQLLLISWCFLFVDRVTGMRRWLDPMPSDREAYRAIAEFVPPGRTVLSRNTYDTFYHGHRYATWPIPWGGTAGQLELFTERDPDRFLASLDRLGIGYLLLPRRTTDREFNGGNFPESFVDCVASLVERGRLRVLWGSASLVLVERAQ